MSPITFGQKENVTSGRFLGLLIGGMVCVCMAANTLGAGPPSTATQPSDGKHTNDGEHVRGKRPNLLFLMADHVGGDIVAPNSQCLTPNLDRLAAEGMRFSRCYTPLGMCSPARASLMTATYPSTHGVWDCTHNQRKEWVDVSPKLEHWAQRLVAAGYHTGYFGKWHLTQSEKLEDYGWQEYDIHCAMHNPHVPGTEVVSRKKGYRDVILAAVRRGTDSPHHPVYEKGIDFIRRHASKGEPFCCFVSTEEPGSVCVAPKRFSGNVRPGGDACLPDLARRSSRQERNAPAHASQLEGLE